MIRDDPSIKVRGNDIDTSIKLLKKRVIKAQTSMLLARREHHPSVQARARAKAWRANQRRNKGKGNDNR